MDKAKALEMLETLRPHGVGGWQIIDFIDNGKSAAVYKAIKDGQPAAVKVFDNELITKFGDRAMLERMEREKWLVGHTHPNIVKMVASGIEPATANHFLVMEYLEGPNLAKAIEQGLIAAHQVPLFVEQLASAAEYLDNQGLAHRDIKPANIVITDNLSRLVLLDFGVLLPVDEAAGITDVGGTPLFIGTNQYASPEFALRKEEKTADSWRAVTFYQIGAVIHDMLMQTPIFQEHTGVPARLAHAVQTEVPVVANNKVPPYLVTLAQNCLVKEPAARLKLLRWDNFRQQQPRPSRSLELQEKIRQRVAAAVTIKSETNKHSQPKTGIATQLLHSVQTIVSEALRGMGDIDPPLPRRIVYVYGDDGSMVRADFEPSDLSALPNGLSVCLQATVLDETSKVISLHGATSLKREHPEWLPQITEIYTGLLRQEPIEDAVILHVLIAVDDAQQQAAIKKD
jgi:eukaryotic-like serine/threonine-protein kinase